MSSFYMPDGRRINPGNVKHYFANGTYVIINLFNNVSDGQIKNNNQIYNYNAGSVSNALAIVSQIDNAIANTGSAVVPIYRDLTISNTVRPMWVAVSPSITPNGAGYNGFIYGSGFSYFTINGFGLYILAVGGDNNAVSATVNNDSQITIGADGVPFDVVGPYELFWSVDGGATLNDTGLVVTSY